MSCSVELARQRKKQMCDVKNISSVVSVLIVLHRERTLYFACFSLRSVYIARFSVSNRAPKALIFRNHAPGHASTLQSTKETPPQPQQDESFPHPRHPPLCTKFLLWNRLLYTTISDKQTASGSFPTSSPPATSWYVMWKFRFPWYRERDEKKNASSKLRNVTPTKEPGILVAFSAHPFTEALSDFACMRVSPGRRHHFAANKVHTHADLVPALVAGAVESYLKRDISERGWIAHSGRISTCHVTFFHSGVRTLASPL